LSGYKRSIFLINPKFQIKYSLIVIAFIFTMGLVYNGIIYALFTTLFKYAPQNVASLELIRKEILMWLSGILVIYMGIAFIVCIFLTHKIAGPLYKVSNFLKNIANGKKPEVLQFRKGDNFIELSHDYNLALDKIMQDYQNDFEYIGEVNSYIKNLSVVIPEDKKPVLNKITQKLSEIKYRYIEE